ncbi:MAG: DUF1207 domain-containing protein [Planctomycetota bacterium]
MKDPFVVAKHLAVASDRPSDGSDGAIRLASATACPATPYGAFPGASPAIGQPAGPAYAPTTVAPAPGMGLTEYATAYTTPAGGWRWELMPDGLIYRSYLAGPRESRLALHTFHNDSSTNRSEWLWDATLGGRRGILRLGNGDPNDPRGWQLDLEGAAVVRLNLDEARDVDASDFRFGVPLTYTADGVVRYKFGYYHVSSHLGDELIARTGVNSRLNYVRDAIIAGVMYDVTPSLRLYGETAYAFFTAGGAEPWEFQFGAEWSRPGCTGIYGTPFLATNAHLREETDFGGDWTLQTGWLWRGESGSALRVGLHYMNGKSTQYQFFNNNEEQVGVGLWYDF